MARIVVMADDGRVVWDEKVEPGAIDDVDRAVEILRREAMALATAEQLDSRSYLNVVG